MLECLNLERCNHRGHNVIKGRDWLRTHRVLLTALSTSKVRRPLRPEMRCFKTKEKEVLLQISRSQPQTSYTKRLYGEV